MRRAEQWELAHEEWFYKTKDGEIYPYYKDDICNEIDIYRPDTFLPFLKALDYPFIEEVWLDTIERLIEHNTAPTSRAVFGRYLSKIRLKSWAHLRFKDSHYTDGVLAYQPEISWTKVDDKWLDEHRSPPPYCERMTYYKYRFAFWGGLGWAGPRSTET